MNKKLKQQKGAIIIMTIFLMFIYLAFAALFVDGFRLYETKQEIDSYTQYITESLTKRMVEKNNDYDTCMRRYNACMERYNECVTRYNECIESEEEECEECIKECKTCGKSTVQGVKNIYNNLINNGTYGKDSRINTVIKRNKTRVNYTIIDDTSVQCNFEIEVSSNNFIFAGIFASKFFGNGGLASEFTINVCLKSCYNKALEDNHIYPYYFRACNRNC